jgi:hypothetical protein
VRSLKFAGLQAGRKKHHVQEKSPPDPRLGDLKDQGETAGNKKPGPSDNNHVELREGSLGNQEQVSAIRHRRTKFPKGDLS